MTCEFSQDRAGALLALEFRNVVGSLYRRLTVGEAVLLLKSWWGSEIWRGGGSILRCRIIFNSFHFTKMDNSIWVIQPNVFGSYKYHMVRKKEVWRSMYDILKIQSLTSVLKKTDIYIKYEILIQWSKYKGVDFLNKKCCNNSPLCIYTLWVTAPCHLNIWLALANGTMTNMT